MVIDMKLVIAEKSSVAFAIASAIGATVKQKGYAEGNGYIVTYCVGHLITSAKAEDYDKRYEKWNKEDLPIIPDIYKTVIVGKTKSQYSLIKKLSERTDVTSLICATDAGREGELIFRLLYYKMGCKKPFERLWISSLTTKSILNGFDNLKDGSQYDNLYNSAYARLRADWIVGINFTRLYSTLYNELLTIGRVQTPTVNIVVKRQLEIDNFVPAPYYVLSVNTGDFIATYKTDNKDEANAVYKRCNNKTGTVTNVIDEIKETAPPKLYNLTSLQIHANKIFGYTAKETLDIAQSLYEKKLLSYPRTDSNYITEDMSEETAELIKNIVCSGFVSVPNYELEKVSIHKVVNNKKVTDHYAIIPTENAIKVPIGTLPEKERNCLLLVVYRLLSAVYSPCTYKNAEIELSIYSDKFIAKGKGIVDEGYLSVEKYIKALRSADSKKETENKEKSINRLVPVGTSYDNVKLIPEKKMTLPPKSYTEATLLSAMKNCGRTVEEKDLKDILSATGGIGTPATQAGIIERIIKTGYIVRKNKNLIPTQKAFKLMDILSDDIKSPELTAQWELELEEISKGNSKVDRFMYAMETYVRNECDSYRADEIDTGLFKELPYGNCPCCNEGTMLKGKTNVYCSNYKNGCKFSVPFMLCKKKLTDNQIKSLITKGKTSKIKGFVSKSGSKFEASLILDKTTGALKFEFDK